MRNAHIAVIVSLLAITIIHPLNAMSSNSKEYKYTNSQFFSKKEKAIRLQYSALNVNATRAVYYVGKPTYAAIQELDSIALSAASGLGGGLHGMFAAVIVDQGISRGLELLQKYVKNPASFSRELGAQYMSDGMKALNTNYNLYKNGIDRLSDRDIKKFRKNQILVDLLGEAKSLYLVAGEDMKTFSSIDPSLEALDAVSEALLDSSIPKSVLTVAKITEIFRRNNLNLYDYEPLNNFLEKVTKHNDTWGCSEPITELEVQIDTTNKFSKNSKSNSASYYNTANISDICSEGDTVACRKYCFESCDQDNDSRIKGGVPEGKCYSDCNRLCDKKCINEYKGQRSNNYASSGKSNVARTGQSKERNVNSSIQQVLCDALIKPQNSISRSSNSGLVVVGPSGSKLSCTSQGSRSTTFGECHQRSNTQNGLIYETIKLNNPQAGRYKIYASASGNSSAITIVDGGINLRSKRKGESAVKKLRNVVIQSNRSVELFSFTAQ